MSSPMFKAVCSTVVPPLLWSYRGFIEDNKRNVPLKSFMCHVIEPPVWDALGFLSVWTMLYPCCPWDTFSWFALLTAAAPRPFLICVLLMYIFVTKCLSVMNSFLPCFLTSQDSGFKVEDLIMFMSIWIQKLKLHYSRGFEKIFRLLVLQVFLNPWSKLFQIVKLFFSLVIN